MAMNDDEKYIFQRVTIKQSFVFFQFYINLNSDENSKRYEYIIFNVNVKYSFVKYIILYYIHSVHI